MVLRQDVLVADDIGAVTNVAEFFLHYLMNGQSNEFDCKDTSRKFVRGQ